MTKATVRGFRPSPEIEAKLAALPAGSLTREVESALRKHFGIEAAPAVATPVEAPTPAAPVATPSEPPDASAGQPDDETATLDAAALDAVLGLPLTIPAREAAKLLRSSLVLSEHGPAFDLGDGGELLPLDSETAQEHLLPYVATRGTGGSGGRTPREARTPRQAEPPSFARVGPDGTVRVDLRSHAAMTEEQRRASLMGGR